ncbi:MAG: ATP-binding cassette domain-containing protein [Chlorobi bacterium]|nr:ATP-binding cassette domain-containing protein [Chlorobiota bacterium]
MNESILNSLMQLYALIAFANKGATKELARSYVETYLKQFFSKKIIEKKLDLFDYYLAGFEHKRYDKKKFKTSFSLNILQICKDINKELHQKQKILVLINALQFIRHWRAFTVEGFENENIVSEIIDTVALVFKFSEDEFNNIKEFIYNEIYKIPNKKELIIIKGDEFFPITGIHVYQKKGIEGQLFVLHVASTNTYLFRYIGKKRLELSGKAIFPKQVYIFEKGTSLKGEYFNTIYYSEIVAQYLLAENKLNIIFEAKEIEFKFPKSENGIHKFSFSGYSGQLIGVMGGSGTGKSTLLNILNGNLKLTHGHIHINGLDIKKDKEVLEGIVGYIPQDDLLIEDLTVFQNLYYNAQLCYGNLSKDEITEKVNNLLVELGLFEARNLKVGNPLHNYISGGQRKRLNIALELIRKPYVLFVDEPTSGLSSSDSEKVIELFKEEALRGKFIMINIHQPSSVIFKQFDKLIILDTGGYPIYFGDPIEAINYVKKTANMVDAIENECHCCGNVNPDQILDIIEQKDIDEYGEFSHKRKITPEKWYQYFVNNNKENENNEIISNKLPVNNFNPPEKWKQFVIFSLRNFYSKIADKQYLIIALLVTPVLSAILGFLTKYYTLNANLTREYFFINNDNIPAFLLMSIIVAMFVGLTISAEEIIKDLKILKRESFLNLSKKSYFNSKIVFLFIISAMQSLAYVVIGNYILEIKDFGFAFWLVMFSLSCFANLTGLNISSAFKSVVTIYILIPLILVPQILLCGVIVKFDKLNYLISADDKVPVVGDLMVSRWAYEALMVTQFKENKYQRNFFNIDRKISQASFIMNYTIPKLNEIANQLFTKNSIKINDKLQQKKINLLKNEITHIIELYSLKPPDFIEELKPKTNNKDIYNKISQYNNNLKKRISKYVDKQLLKRDELYSVLLNKIGKENVQKMKFSNVNDRINEFVLNNKEISRIKTTQDKIVQLYEPIYITPRYNNGRAQFYAPVKILWNYEIDTLVFNIIAIWLFVVILYIALINEWMKKIILKIENIVVKK